MVASVHEIGLVPMILLKRAGTTAPRPIALIGFTVGEHETFMTDLPRMSEEGMLELLCGSPKVLYKPPVRWWPLG